MKNVLKTIVLVFILGMNSNLVLAQYEVSYFSRNQRITISETVYNETESEETESGESENLKPTIYIQYSSKKNIDEAKTVQVLLTKQQWFVPGIGFDNDPCDNSIRYFHDQDKEIAIEIASLLKGKYKIIAQTNLSDKMPTGQIEIWIK